jgi:oxygen-independent coproporphyrinogen-3 oxidase
MQSAVSRELALLGRRHSREDAAVAVTAARQAGFENINLDLIFGIPGQTMASFRESLDFATELEPEHLSLYALTLEEATPLAKAIREGKIQASDDDLAADMYAMAMEMLEKLDYRQYEISNWSRSGRFECRHNLQYWRNQPYLGFGVGAHSHYKESRWENHASIKKYISSLISAGSGRISPAATEINKLNKQTMVQETIMMGLRLTREGLKERQFELRFGVSLEDLYKKEISLLINQGLLEWNFYEKVRCLRLTRRGKMLGNQVFMRFMGD